MGVGCPPEPFTASGGPWRSRRAAWTSLWLSGARGLCADPRFPSLASAGPHVAAFAGVAWDRRPRAARWAPCDSRPPCPGSPEPVAAAGAPLAGLAPHLRHVLFWMSNAVELLYFAQQQCPLYMQSLEEELDVTGTARAGRRAVAGCVCVGGFLGGGGVADGPTRPLWSTARGRSVPVISSAIPSGGHRSLSRAPVRAAAALSHWPSAARRVASARHRGGPSASVRSAANTGRGAAPAGQSGGLHEHRGVWLRPEVHAGFQLCVCLTRTVWGLGRHDGSWDGAETGRRTVLRGT